MKHTNSLIIILTGLFLFIIACAQEQKKGVINTPITDLLGQPIKTTRPDQSVENAYATIASCGSQLNAAYSCPRLHQLLYSDQVDIIKNTHEEVCIRITHAYYLIPSSTSPQTDYWTLKKNITPIDDLIAHNIPLSHLPDPIHFSDIHHQALNHPDVVTLIEPHYDPTLHITFATGTRFVCVPNKNKNKKKSSHIKVFAFNYTTIKEYEIKIPHQKCFIIDETKNTEQRITDYVNLLKKWSHTKNGSIPYTLGGTGFTHTVPGKFKEITKKTDNGDYSFYEYEKDTTVPKNGFDCSGVILRAAQICGIPYFCKNTATIPHCLTPLTPTQTVSNGDLILIKGHVMIVSDVAKNLLIEARSYAHGYGKLHEIPISHVFENIETYKDLTDAYYNKAVVKRKDKQGKVRDTFTNLQIFPMMSTWKQQKTGDTQ